MNRGEEIITSVVNEIEILGANYEEILKEKEEEIGELTSIIDHMQAKVIKLETESRFTGNVDSDKTNK